MTSLLNGGSGDGWRTASLVEHHGPDADPADPDKPAKNSGNPSTYSAMRTARYTYVEYTTGELEYYDRTSDPAELNNTASTLTQTRKEQLHAALAKLVACHGTQTCWAAGQVS